jgi:hypothetical protein
MTMPVSAKGQPFRPLAVQPDFNIQLSTACGLRGNLNTDLRSD